MGIFPGSFNDLFKVNFETEQEFFNELPNIPQERVVKGIEKISINRWIITSYQPLIDKIFSHFNNQAAQGSLKIPTARRIALASLRICNTSLKIKINVEPFWSHQFAAMSSEAYLEEKVIFPKVILFSSSSLFRGFGDNLEKISLGRMQETPSYLCEFLLTGKIQDIDRLSTENLDDLGLLGLQFKIKELLDYLTQCVKAEHHFYFFYKRALELKSCCLFETCLQAKFGHGFEIKIVNFDEMKLNIQNLHEKAEKQIDQLCQFLIDLRKQGLLPKLKEFTVIANPSINSEEPPKTFMLDQGEIKLIYPASLKETLTYLSVSQGRISIEKVFQLANECKNLQSVSLPIFKDYDCRKFNELEKMIQQCKDTCPHFNSIHLNLESIKQEDVKSFENCEQLKTYVTGLTLDNCEIDDEFLRFFAEQCSNLKVLNLGSSSGKGVTDRGLEFLAMQCKQLNNLNLSTCQNITPQGIKALAQSCPNICRMNVMGLNEEEMTDELLEILAQAWPKLQYFSIPGKRVTDKGLFSLANCAPNLKVLDLGRAGKITNEGLKKLSQKCPQFIALTIKANPHITKKEMKKALSLWPNFEWLFVQSCKHFEDKDFKNFFDLFPKLKRYNFHSR